MQHSTALRLSEREAKDRTSFASLPGYDELRLFRSIGQRIGLDNPYFRVHEARAGSQTRIAGHTILNFSSYDYLGLNEHPEVVQAATMAIDRYGISASASRHVAGERPVHRALERALADHYGVDDSLGSSAGMPPISGSSGRSSGPSLCHNSIVMGGTLSGAARRSFAHNDLDALDQMLAATRNNFDRALIVVEGHYSMDGDYPDLPRLLEIKARHDAWLMVDEAHSLGVLGRRGYGIAEHFAVDPRCVDIWMGTLSKTLAGCGGYIAGCKELVDYLRLTVGAFVFSVGMPPVIAAAAHKALEILHREPERVGRLQHNAASFFTLARDRGLNTGTAAGTAVCPIMVGDSLPAVVLSQRLLERGLNALPVTHPAVPAKSSRLRFFVTAMHTQAQIETAIEVTADEFAKVRERAAEFDLTRHG
jgi:7-keto-8-aminopelargonate synthetase-like enzyme